MPCLQCNTLGIIKRWIRISFRFIERFETGERPNLAPLKKLKEVGKTIGGGGGGGERKRLKGREGGGIWGRE